MPFFVADLTEIPCIYKLLRSDKTKKGDLHLNNNEIPGFLSHGIMIELSSQVKNNMISSQVKRLPQ